MIKYGHPPRGDAGFSVRLSIFWIFFRGIMKINKIVMIILITIFTGISITYGILRYIDYKEQEKIRNAIVKIEFIDNLDIPFNSDVKLSDLITSINGELITDPKIDTTTLGKEEVRFRYINEEDIKVPYTFYVNIIDNTPPTIWLNESYTVNVGYSKKLEDAILCADDYDDNPKCSIIGEYDVNKIGNYNLVMEAYDFSGNKTSKKFNLKVTKPSNKTSSSSKSIPFRSLYNEYKKNDNKIGIDVSKWQGDIDYLKVKEEGVEFAFIKLGGQKGINKDYYLDPKYEQNIRGFKSVGIPVGLYFYSYANTPEAAQRDALWVISQIKGEEIEYGIAFDWENWGSFNNFKMSFNTLTKSADKFLSTIKSHGYDALLYSSKTYLENMWLRKDYPVWLAHYTEKTNYTGEYKCWQRTSLAKINGITSNTVDFDICY